MKLPSFDRRRFFQFLFSVFVVSSCKKTDPSEIISQNQTSKPPVAPPLIPTTYDLGTYTTTEIGNNLVSDPNFNKIINGYTDKVSYNPGDTVNVYLSGPASANTSIPLLDTQRNTIYTVSTPIVTQTIKSDKPWVDGFMFDKTFSFKIPDNFKSGIYTWLGEVPFICSVPDSSADITVVYPSNTLNAYNTAGGKSLYSPDITNRATVVSFLRSNIIFYQEFYQWIDKQNYTINYIADSDLDSYNLIQNSKLVIITGHSEYWTRQGRLNIDKFVDSGKNILLLSGNNMWWQVRYNNVKNLMICYKGEVSNLKGEEVTTDPLKGSIYSTINWGAPSLNYSIFSSIGCDYRFGGLGGLQSNIGFNGYKIVQDKSPLLAGTRYKNGDILSMPSTEYDGTLVKSFFPPGSSEIPVIDNTALNFHKVELLGYDFATNTNAATNNLGFGTFMVSKKSPESGTIINTASMDWVYNIFRSDISRITKNMIDLSLANTSLFSD